MAEQTEVNEKQRSNRQRYGGDDSDDSLRAVPLRVVIVDGMLAMEIGLDTLKCVVDHGPSSGEFKLLDVNKLARELVVILANGEDETGMTPIMHVLDNAIEQAIEDGSSAFEEIGLGDVLDGE